MNSPSVAMSTSSGTLEAVLAFGDSGDNENRDVQESDPLVLIITVCLVVFSQMVQSNRILLTMFLRY